MYKQDKVSVDVRIDGMTGELSRDIEHMKKIVDVRKKAYEEAHEANVKAMNAAIDAMTELNKAERELSMLESIDAQLRKAKEDVDQAYDAWFDWQMS